MKTSLDANRPCPVPRFYVLRVIDAGHPVRVSVIPGVFNDLVDAWQVAGRLRRLQPHEIFIAGEMCSTQ